MERKSAERVGLCSIFLVSGYRVADPLGMYPDLVLSACFKLEFNLSIGRVSDRQMF